MGEMALKCHMPVTVSSDTRATPHCMPKHQPAKGARDALAQVCLRKRSKELGLTECNPG